MLSGLYQMASVFCRCLRQSQGPGLRLALMSHPITLLILNKGSYLAEQCAPTLLEQNKAMGSSGTQPDPLPNTPEEFGHAV